MENQILYQIFECATVIFETFIVHQYISGLFAKRDEQKSATLWYVVFCIGLMILSVFWREGLALTTYTLVVVYALATGVYQTSVSSRIFAVFYFAAIMMVAEILTTGMVAGIWKIELPNMFEFGLPRVLCIVITKLVQIFLVKGSVSVANWRKRNSSKGEPRMMLPLLVCQVFSVILAYYVFVISVNILNGFSLLSLIAMAGIIYMNIIIFWYFDRIKAAFDYKSKSEAAEYKIELQKQYHDILIEHQRETDALWHDMKKHLTLIKSLVTDGHMAIASEYVHELETQMSDNIKIIRTDYPVLSALLTEQKQRAQKADISFDMDVHLDSELRMDPVDLCIILGNLFDNAFEACTLLPSEMHKSIIASIGQRNNAVAIVFENTYMPTSKPRIRSGKHGLGLKNVRQAVSKYNGQISVSEENNIFRLSIIVP